MAVTKFNQLTTFSNYLIINFGNKLSKQPKELCHSLYVFLIIWQNKTATQIVSDCLEFVFEVKSPLSIIFQKVLCTFVLIN